MSELETLWNQRHLTASPWDSGRPCAELQRVLAEVPIAPCRTLEVGCGNGRNAVMLAQRGFEVTATDIASEALQQGQAAARAAKVDVRFVQSDVLKLPDIGAPFAFVLDRGLYQHARATDRLGFERVLERVTAPGSFYLAMMPSANDTVVRVPRAVKDYEVCLDYARVLKLVQLREIRFEPALMNGREVRPLMWSALFIRK
jgi:SAM-dependent methyltransferase